MHDGPTAQTRFDKLMYNPIQNHVDPDPTFLSVDLSQLFQQEVFCDFFVEKSVREWDFSSQIWKLTKLPKNNKKPHKSSSSSLDVE